MTPDDRELIRSNIHQIDLLLRKIDRKAMAMLEVASHVQGIIKEIEELKKPIYQLLDEEYKSNGNNSGNELIEEQRKGQNVVMDTATGNERPFPV